MLSRTASGLYWMARYLERAEQLARVFRRDQPFVVNAGAR